MNCMCLALLTRSWMRKTTKLAGTNDIAKITQIDTSTSTDVVTLKKKQNRLGHLSTQKPTRHELLKEEDNVNDYSQCHLRDLLFGKVQRVIVDCDAIFARVFPWRQIGPQNTVVHHVEE